MNEINTFSIKYVLFCLYTATNSVNTKYTLYECILIVQFYMFNHYIFIC